MESTLFNILGELQASPADYIIIAMGFSVVIVLVWLIKRHFALEHKYHQLDKLVLVQAHIIKDKLNIKTVNIHRTGDYEVENPLNGGE
tara:strand:+ start:841 stop:1104 length:264 start_codon:yes stop_codon:yes gene_type:complete